MISEHGLYFKTKNSEHLWRRYFTLSYCDYHANKSELLKNYFCGMNSDTGKYIIIGGLMIVLLGLIIYFFHDKLSWMGRLPGDIRVEKENFKFYFPVTTMILFSLAITIVIQILKRIF